MQSSRNFKETPGTWKGNRRCWVTSLALYHSERTDFTGGRCSSRFISLALQTYILLQEPATWSFSAPQQPSAAASTTGAAWAHLGQHKQMKGAQRV